MPASRPLRLVVTALVLAAASVAASATASAQRASASESTGRASIERAVGAARSGDVLSAARAATTGWRAAFRRARDVPPAASLRTHRPAAIALGSVEGVTPLQRRALGTVMDAFASFRRAGASLGSATDPIAAFARVLDTRQALLRSALRLEDAFRGARVRPSTHTQATCLDLAGVPSLHTAWCTLSIDVGGNDRYRNNAGGTSGGAAAAIDLGGSDSYASTLNIGSNGGGSFGAGFLFDAGGNDSYVGGNQASNGGGYLLGAGFLLDAGGSDRYTGRACTNGGACAFASGTLLDLGTQNDVYSAGGGAVNGGVLAVSHGMLLDSGGTDTYVEGAPCYGSGVDRTVVPKGDGVGAQLDSTNLRGRTCVGPPPPPPATIFHGSIWGRVSAYGTGEGITGATVDCRRAGTGVSLLDGRYSIPAAPGGIFRCTASASGFRTESRDVTVRPGFTSTANFALRRAAA